MMSAELKEKITYSAYRKVERHVVGGTTEREQSFMSLGSEPIA